MRFHKLHLLLAVVFAGFLTACAPAGVSLNQSPVSLRAVIEEQIKSHVRLSYGELDGECFTDADLQRMIQERVPALIAEQLKTDPGFRTAIDQMRAMSVDERNRYLLRSREPVHKTWEELGHISSEGQTVSGQRAESLIADSVVNLAETLLASPAPSSHKI
jgi:hypothetical protein